MPIHSVTPAELKTLVAQQPDLPLIDVRTSLEFVGGHVEGAENVPLHRLSAERIDSALGERKNGVVYFICKSGGRSRMACEEALAWGESKVVNVEGGTSGCAAAGLPMARDPNALSLPRLARYVGGAALIFLALGTLQHPVGAMLFGILGAVLIVSGRIGV